MTTAHEILKAAQQHMKDRAKKYDSPSGERSMAATVAAFNAVTDSSMTEEQGWLFMVMLKAVRSQQGGHDIDSFEDGAAYLALAGEAASRGAWAKEKFDRATRDIPAMDNEELIALLQSAGAEWVDDMKDLSGWCFPSAYKNEWVLNTTKSRPVDPDVKVFASFRNGDVSWKPEAAEDYRWNHTGSGGDIIAYRIAK